MCRSKQRGPTSKRAQLRERHAHRLALPLLRKSLSTIAPCRLPPVALVGLEAAIELAATMRLQRRLGFMYACPPAACTHRPLTVAPPPSYLTYRPGSATHEVISLVQRAVFALVAVSLTEYHEEQLAVAVILVMAFAASSLINSPWMPHKTSRQCDLTSWATSQMQHRVEAIVPTPSLHEESDSSVSQFNPVVHRINTAFEVEVAEESAHMRITRRCHSCRCCSMSGLNRLKHLPEYISSSAIELTGYFVVITSIAAVPILKKDPSFGNTTRQGPLQRAAVVEGLIFAVNALYMVASAIVIGLDFTVEFSKNARIWLRRKRRQTRAASTA